MNRLSIMAVLIAFPLSTLFDLPALADPVKQHRSAATKASCTLTNDGRRMCGSSAQSLSAKAARTSAAYASGDGAVIGGRPAGCPHRYCGCGLRKYLGLSDKRLNLARNWARMFPRVAGPAAGVAAVRSGHVMYIERSVGNGQWLVRDYNSGGGASRLHVRDVRGYVFVNPHAMLASN
jgi:hypothetical protein